MPRLIFFFWMKYVRLRLYFFIAAQTAQVVQTVDEWYSNGLGNLSSNKEI